MTGATERPEANQSCTPGIVRVDRQVRRLRKKLEHRDRRIVALQKRVAALESAMSTSALDAKRLPRDVTRAVQEALCNVRLIPLLGVGNGGRIVEVKMTDA